MSENITLEILPDGRIRFKRGSKQHNEHMIKVLTHVIDDQETMDELSEFFKGSEDVELLMGSTIFCGQEVNIMKMMKVFDCTDMPSEVEKAFFYFNEDVCNDIYVCWDIGESDFTTEKATEKYKLVDDWLFGNGATEKYEEVLIHHWW